ncbi:peptide-methionine (R)-S-oxide reductase MsrB [Pelagicoccus sp. SDUM812003]|uniref:peptide-methionine (R)-S-oxide reductase MsrB n=1 Tax=Pelagicoccus sp. SDUM812003 TaxID=3041267 RepID=UPI00280E2F28|nr:peptide-methionine (R)-S-oxide reductase MsrB [Pelagicoccus sp. SDUM812003]MDQ8202449.1 peptide-methionine (R)-S-oxide reductase MsrB [Pelagicoccus sp. SDUM812003]
MKPFAAALTTTLFTTLAMADDNASTHSQKTNLKEQDLAACAVPSEAETTALDAFRKTDEEWKKVLSPEQFRVLRQQGTERSFQNAYWNNKEKGLYLCAACEAPLFASAQKYDSGTGWPSFWESIAPENVGETRDTSYGMVRTEVHCSRCGGHLGHVFEDGPKPTHLRYCINSASLEFVKKNEIEERDLQAYAEHAR